MDLLQKNLIKKIPKEVSHVTETLERAGFEAYLVGGCVRDLLMSIEPKDWDITTSAKPEQIIELFEKTVYENTFGTVAVIQEDVSQETLRQIEVTPYRIESKYSDFRHPDEIKFSDKLEDDLKRRDFTINAMALDSKGHLVDLFDGRKDMDKKILRTVGDPESRFSEDALRMLRAVRFALQLNFSIAYEVSENIIKNSDLIKKISAERIRDEFVKIIMSKNPSAGIVMLEKFGLLKNIIPELEEGINCEQSGEHIYDVWDHSLHALQHSADKNWPLEIRLSALFHDIGKPKSRRLSLPTNNFSGPRFSGSLSRPNHSKSFVGSKKLYTFYGHEVVSARMAKKILERLKFSSKEIELVDKLVRNHMFFSDTEQITLSAVRRIIAKVGKENIWSLMNVRECDRVGMKKKEAPYRLRKYFAMIEEALHDPISVGQLKINGELMIKDIGMSPGPRMGWILHALLEEVIEDPKKNTTEYLKDKAQKLDQLSDLELRTLGEKGKEIKEELEEKEVLKLHEKHGVKKTKALESER
ncbi:HD domain-containing protein [Patescibacteria group bacterium]|nr:HD domain-containing protein [Patescibacteria group bacterium]